ncbi:hypothetical protein QUF72_07405 [Desulfobacterales bacterium HSG2]|nr:hypothetical protein [Desulfobacterales bacterium HSG2]
METKKKRCGVWERKSESEIDVAEKEIGKSAYSLVMPLWILIISFFALGMISPNKIHCLFFSILLFIATYLLQICNGRSFASSPSLKICNKCMKENWLDVKNCYCGGKLEPSEYYNFIEKKQIVLNIMCK